MRTRRLLKLDLLSSLTPPPPPPPPPPKKLLLVIPRTKAKKPLKLKNRRPQSQPLNRALSLAKKKLKHESLRKNSQVVPVRVQRQNRPKHQSLPPIQSAQTLIGSLICRINRNLLAPIDQLTQDHLRQGS